MAAAVFVAQMTDPAEVYSIPPVVAAASAQEVPPVWGQPEYK